MSIDDIPNKKASYMKGNNEVALKGLVDYTINDEELLIDATTMD
jgi:hypothetical protein